MLAADTAVVLLLAAAGTDGIVTRLFVTHTTVLTLHVYLIILHRFTVANGYVNYISPTAT